MIQIPERVYNLIPYKPGKSIYRLNKERNLNRIVKLASNENPLGSSPKALKAIQENLGSLHRYTDSASTELVKALAVKYGKRPTQIICGHGVDSLLMDIILTFTDESDEILTSEGSFIGAYVNTKKLGRNLSLAPLKNYQYDLPSILNAISPKTKIIYLANPNNPTASVFCKTEFDSWISQVPDDILVVLDESYSEYALPLCPDFPNGLNYDLDNLIVTRTFSKFHGLAGIRIGFAVGPEYLIKELYKVKLPFEPNFLAQKAALAALDDIEFGRRTLEVNSESLRVMREKLVKLGFEVLPSYTNFILLLLPGEEIAASFYRECLDRGLIVRHVTSFGIPNGIRINSATMEDTAFALEVIEEVCGGLLQPCVAARASETDNAV
jgi:histidinol-phosphate aminotransferase